MEPVRFGKFTLLELIASGGMAEIYKAAGVTVGGKRHLLAIKRILPQYTGDREFISLLIDEAKLMVFLSHPNIVPIVEFGKVEDSYYIAMDYVEGTTLKGLYQRLRDRKQLFTIDMALHIVREIGSGLAYAHRKTDRNGKPLKIVHRDISPANILLSFEGEVKIADFGISKAANQRHQTQIGVIRGKTGYMSPEQTRAGASIDHRSDLYALGIILYELLTGERLYLSDSVPEALKLIRKGEVPVPSSVRPQIPPQLDELVLKALAVNPDDRYQHGEEFVDAINEFLARFAPGGRAVRVTHTDLIGFLRRYFAAEMSGETTPAELRPADLKTAVFGGSHAELTGPETIAQNPLYEMSDPEFAPSADRGRTQVSSESRETTVADSSVSLVDAPSGKIRTSSRFGRWFAAAALAMAGASAVVWMKWRRPENPPAPVVQSYTLTIESVPPDADIYVDGEKKDRKTPATISVQAQEGRNIVITVGKAGFKDEKKQIHPAGGGMRPLMFTLAAIEKPRTPTAAVEIRTDPPRARVLLDGKEAGRTPLQLEIEVGKPARVRVEKKGYKVWEKEIKADGPGKIENEIILVEDLKATPRRTPKPAVRKFAKLTVRFSNPPWGYVSIDGKQEEEGPFKEKTVPAGRHQLVISHPDVKRELDVTLFLKPDTKTVCDFNLETQQWSCN